MKWRIIGILIALVLAVGLSLIIAVSVEANGSGPSTWYVDGTLGTDDISHGTGNGTAAFKTIHYAINSASANDTINVAAGAYDEDLTIEKSLTIQGAGDATRLILLVLYQV